jgi:2-polyprenyl-3-methyl-5-hydroxy-6-metoxy-1,4-benzoquinol methylase
MGKKYRHLLPTTPIVNCPNFIVPNQLFQFTLPAGMSNTIIHYTSCPVCGSQSIKPVLQVKDHSVSRQEFSLWECGACSLRFTQDVPDAASIGPYYQSEDYISHTNTSKGLVNKLYQFVRKRTMTAKRKLIEKHTGIKNGNLLDIGSGVGSFAAAMKAHHWKATGLEPDKGAREVARQLYGIQLQEIDSFYQLPASSFDAITMWHVLEHVHELQPYIAQLKNLLKDSGKLFIAVPNYTAKDAAIYGEYWAAYDVPRHLYHFSPQSLTTLVAKHGLKVEKYQPMWYDSFYIALLSSKYKNGSTNLPAAFINGLRSNFQAMGNVKKCSSVIYIISK